MNNNIVPLNDFTQNYIASVLCAIAHTFGDDSRNVTMHIEPEEFHIYTENGELDIKKVFAKGLVESTVKGILSPLKGVFWSQNITIISEGSKAPTGSLKKGLTGR
ncbi:MAG: hypothetical protein QMD07_03145 [Thermodesulfovibrionales bacterium]|nr:hypothetical protein [Thermodesulfovibrionales bacterium]